MNPTLNLTTATQGSVPPPDVAMSGQPANIGSRSRALIKSNATIAPVLVEALAETFDQVKVGASMPLTEGERAWVNQGGLLILVASRPDDFMGVEPDRLARLRWIRIGIGTDGFQIGPAALSMDSSCIECCRAFVSSPQGNLGAPLGNARMPVLHLAAATLSRTLGVAGDGLEERPSWRVDKFSAHGQHLESFFVPGDALCHRIGHTFLPAADFRWAQIYEWMHTRRPHRGQGTPKATPPSLYSRRDLSDFGPRLSSTNSSPPTSNKVPGSSRSPVPLEMLIRGLGVRADHPDAGLSSDLPRFWAPSGGNLRSVQAYIESTGGLGVPRGLWKFDDLRGELRGVRRSILSDTEAVQPPEALQAGQFRVYLVAELWRLRPKYGEFSIRLGHLDGGCALAHLWLAARLVGLKLRVGQGWSKVVADFLELREDELVVAVVICFPTDGGPKVDGYH